VRGHVACAQSASDRRRIDVFTCMNTIIINKLYQIIVYHALLCDLLQSCWCNGTVQNEQGCVGIGILIFNLEGL
jgi:hypothetical protein